MKLRSNKGFSLVELIIVIAILGIIALIAVPNLTGIQKRSQVNADIRTAESIGKAVRIWLTDAMINVQKTRENAINGTTNSDGKGVEYKGLDSIEDYISQDYIAQALSGGKYYVNLIGDKVVVSIATAAPAKPTSLSDVYKLTDGVATAGVAYIEGKSSLEGSTPGKANL